MKFEQIGRFGSNVIILYTNSKLGENSSLSNLKWVVALLFCVFLRKYYEHESDCFDYFLGRNWSGSMVIEVGMPDPTCIYCLLVKLSISWPPL